MHGTPALGIAAQTFTAVHGTGLGSGLVGAMNSAFSNIPLIGAAIAKGGIASAVASGVTGIGGVLLGQFIEKKENGKTGIKWGKVVKYAALITSALIAMPAILSGITMGIVYCSTAFSGLELGSAAIDFLAPTLGASGAMGATAAGLSGAAFVIPHILTCGLPMIATGAAWFLGKNKKHADKHSERVSDDSSSIVQKYSDCSVSAEMQMDGKVVAGKPVNAKLVLKHRNGQPITPAELAVVHTEKLHLFVADSSLKDYHHIHPQPTGEPGVLAFSFTPQTSNNYSAWADFTMIKNGQNHKLRTEMPSASGRNIPASVRANSHAENKGLNFDWKSEPLQKDVATVVEVNVTDARGKPATDLEPVMGAFAHLVGFSADGKSIIHTHPLDAEPRGASDRGGPRLRFHVEPDCSGATQFYLQVKRGGEDVYVPFGQQIKPPALATARTAPLHAAMGHAM